MKNDHQLLEKQVEKLLRNYNITFRKQFAKGTRESDSFSHDLTNKYICFTFCLVELINR